MHKAVIVFALVAVAAGFPMPEERLYEQEEYAPPSREYAPALRSYQEAEERQYKQPVYKEAPPKPYAFDYGVRDDYSGANYGHSETSNGNQIEGSYQVALPDGRIQIVKYIADHKNGFQAQVEYEGEATYPEHVPHNKEPQYKEAPQYKAPAQPSYEPRYKPAPQPQYHPSESQINFQDAVVHEPAGQEYE